MPTATGRAGRLRLGAVERDERRAGAVGGVDPARCCPSCTGCFPRTWPCRAWAASTATARAGRTARSATIDGNDVQQVHRYLDLGAQLTVCHGPVDVLAADAVAETPRLRREATDHPDRDRRGQAAAHGRLGALSRKTRPACSCTTCSSPRSSAARPARATSGSGARRSIARPLAALRPLQPRHRGPRSAGRRVSARDARTSEAAGLCARSASGPPLLWCRDTANDWQTELIDGHAPQRSRASPSTPPASSFPSTSNKPPSASTIPGKTAGRPPNAPTPRSACRSFSGRWWYGFRRRPAARRRSEAREGA